MFLKGSAHVFGKFVMYPCAPFCSGVPRAFLVYPSVYRAYRLKSTDLEHNKQFYILLTSEEIIMHYPLGPTMANFFMVDLEETFFTEK